MIIEELKNTWQEFLLFKDTSVIDIFLAVVISNLMHWDSLNLMLIGPPGSGKTEMANFLDKHPAVHIVDSLTAHSFISGFQESKRTAGQVSLLNDLKRQNKKVLVFKDMSTLLSMHSDIKKEIISQIRRISDGQLSRVVGNKMSFTWTGKLGFIGMTTPQIDANIDIIRELGERWIYWRLEPEYMPTPEEIAKKAQSNVGREYRLRQRISESTATFLNGVVREYNGRGEEEKEFNMETDWSEQIRNIAIMISNLRKVVGRNLYTRDLEYKPYAESPGRVTRYYTQLAICLSIVSKRGMDDIVGLVKRSAIYSLPELKVDILRNLYDSGDDRMATMQLARKLNIPYRTALNILEDYQISGIAESLEVEKEKMWRLTDKTRADIRGSNIFDLQRKRSKVKAKDGLEEVEGW